jgi:hypothetical protein
MNNSTSHGRIAVVCTWAILACNRSLVDEVADTQQDSAHHGSRSRRCVAGAWKQRRSPVSIQGSMLTGMRGEPWPVEPAA